MVVDGKEVWPLLGRGPEQSCHDVVDVEVGSEELERGSGGGHPRKRYKRDKGWKLSVELETSPFDIEAAGK